MYQSLVSNETGIAEPPIIGYNVIELIMKNGMEQHPEVTPAVVSDAFSIDCNKTNVLIQLVQSHDKHDKDNVVKVGGQKTVLPAGQTREIKCNVRTGPLSRKQEVLFEPDEIPKWPEGLTITETVICLPVLKDTGPKLQFQSLMMVTITSLSHLAPFWAISSESSQSTR